MAQSPSHKLGQIIGEMLEAAIREPLERVAARHGLYLDYKHKRAARSNRSKVAWTDSKGNCHDLDYVLEEGGSEERIGKPVGFIEIAWRRYTKHSRNKAQEIQGAIGPLAETYHESRPFLGVVLGGVFTSGALAQLTSHNFQLLHFKYDDLVAAFAQVGVDVSFDESTSAVDLARKVASYSVLPATLKEKIPEVLRKQRKKELKAFIAALESSINRQIEFVVVFPLFGTPTTLTTVSDALTFLHKHGHVSGKHPFVRFELLIRYINGDEIRGSFQNKEGAIELLQKHAGKAAT
jgi:hypothetical protein